MAKDSRVVKEAVRAYMYVGIWMSVSISVILFNKWLLAYAGFPFPIALTLWHMTFCSALGWFCVRVLKVTPTHNLSAQEYVKRVMPIGLLYAASLWLSNTSYLYLSVSFIQMTKSLMPGLVYLSGCYIGTEKFKIPVALDMLLIAFGVLVCALGELNLVAKGLVVQLTALLFEATRLSLIQVLMNSRGQKMDSFQSLYYVCPACMVCLVIPFFVGEFTGVRALLASPDYIFRPPVFLANACTAFLLNLAVFLLIGKTSALTMNIAGVIKDWLLIYSSYSMFHAPVTMLNLTGYAFCCSGVAVYNYLKMQDIRTPIKGNVGSAPSLQARTLRSKETVLFEMRQLQDELNDLDRQIQAGHLDDGDKDSHV